MTGIERILNNFIGPSYVGLFIKRGAFFIPSIRGAAAVAATSRFGIILNATHADSNPCDMYVRDDADKEEKIEKKTAPIKDDAVRQDYPEVDVARQVNVGDITAGDVYMAVATKDPSYLGLSEIRSFIRESISQIEKHESHHEDDDDIDEYSVTGGISGVITPLGTDAAGRRSGKDQHIKRTKTAAKFFGGGSLADPDGPKREYTSAEKFAKGIVKNNKR